MKTNDIILKEIRRDGNRVEFLFDTSECLKPYFSTNCMFVEYDFNIESVPDGIISIPFASCMLAFSWIVDCNIWVKDIDRTFYNSIPRIRQAYQEIYDQCVLGGRFVPAIIKSIQLQCDNNVRQSKALLLFSGGADCQTSFIRNLEKSPLLCNIQGWYDSIGVEDEVAEADKRDIKAFAEEYNVPSSFVKSNFAKLITPLFDKKFSKKLGDTMWHGFLHSMAFIGISIPVAFQRGIKEIIIASSLTIGLNHYCASNSTTDSEFSFATGGFVTHDGFELNRQGKMSVIVKHQKERGKPFFMRVCSFNDHNCCECEKCFRTILGIIAEGGNIRDFGFEINESLKDHWQDVMDRKAGLMGFTSEKKIHWPHIRKRMIENYESIEDKEFVDWFLSFDFGKAKRIGLLKYYRKNFLSILLRKLHLV